MKFIQPSRRGLSVPGFLGAMILILVVVFIAILIFNRIAGRGAGAIEERFTDFADYDNDQVANFYDRCPCTAYGLTDSTTLRGCPAGYTAEQSQQDKQLFKAKKCPEIASSSTVAQDSNIQDSASTSASLTIFADRRQYRSGDVVTTASTTVTYEFQCTVPCIVEITGPDSTLLVEHDGSAAGTYPLELEQAGNYRFHLYGEGVDLGIDVEKTGGAIG